MICGVSSSVWTISRWLCKNADGSAPSRCRPFVLIGYDVADYYAIDPSLGTMTDLDDLVAAASAIGIGIVMDLVPNHTSIDHPWFAESRSSRDDPQRDWYVWADPGADGGPPNNWVSVFGGGAWTLDEPTGSVGPAQLPPQPDLNWWNHEVRDEFDAILRFWFDRGDRRVPHRRR